MCGFTCLFISGAIKVTVIISCTTTFFFFFFFFPFFNLPSSYFLTVEHCIWFFYRSYLFYYFCRRLLVNFDCIFVILKLLQFCSPNVHSAAHEHDCGGKKIKKSTLFVNKETFSIYIFVYGKHLIFYPCCIWLHKASPQRCYKTWI